MAETAHAVQEKKLNLEEELAKCERQIYELEGEYLQETVKDGNVFRGWDGYLGLGASSGAIRRINRFREADRLFSASSATSASAVPSGRAGEGAASSSKVNALIAGAAPLRGMYMCTRARMLDRARSSLGRASPRAANLMPRLTTARLCGAMLCRVYRLAAAAAVRMPR